MKIKRSIWKQGTHFSIHNCHNNLRDIVQAVVPSSADWFASQKNSPLTPDHLLIDQRDEGPGLGPHLVLFAWDSSCWRHVDLRAAPVATYWAWHCSMVTTLIVNIWEVLAILKRCAEWNVVICHNVSEEISISWTSVGGGARAGGGGVGVVPPTLSEVFREEGERLLEE